ncbi:ferrous iron transporter B [Prevotella sp. CAG:1031]|nr:ferrous iron transporter B [Prevotella sp. CAG:1031]
MRLSDLKPGQSAVVVKVLGHGAFRKRMIEMGFVKGRTVKDMLQAPLNDPVKYSLMGYEVSLRRSEAAQVVVAEVDSQGHPRPDNDQAAYEIPLAPGHLSAINVALIGNPNCGKTSLFNVASGAREHVGNYSGVTVDAKTGTFRQDDVTFRIVDLPGTYSLACYSPEELYVRKYLRDNEPDVIVNIVDATNLERNLYLTTELINMNRPMVIALNMFDELKQKGISLDYKKLSEMIGVPIVPTVARTGEGIRQLFDAVIAVAEDRHAVVRHVHVTLGKELEQSVGVLNRALKADPDLRPRFSPRYMAIKLLENDKEVESLVEGTKDAKEIFELRDREVERLAEVFPGEDVSSLIAGESYGFISGALAETMEQNPVDSADTTRVLDAIVTNRLFGFPIFLAIMAFIFWATFSVGQYPMDWIEAAVGWLGSLVEQYMPDGPLKDLIGDGIIGGVGGVIVFLPNILILYFCLSFLEDSGYMARAAFIMDKVMHRMGIHGKSFIPLVMGFGCNVPAIMSTRSIESRSSRLITILINPFMSCSARVPIYVLLIGAFFPDHATLAFMSLYILGILVAVLTARMLRRFYFKADETPFVMELPPYRLPTFKASCRHMWAKGEQYLRKMGGVILVASIIVWALNYFPLHDEQASTPSFEAEQIDEGRIDTSRDSYLEMAGKAVNPVMEPAGFHWRATVAVLAGIPAKEIVVSSLGVLYTGDEEVAESKLSERIKAPNPVTGKPDFTSASALAFMVFVLLYFPCMATLVAIVKETGHWGYGLFSVVYNTAVAWLAAVITYQIAIWL